MPPLSFGIPVLRRSGETTVDKETTSNRSLPRPRTYNDGPLPVKPSNQTPRNAQITGRELKDDLSVAYQIKIGKVELNDVGLEEILDYVSPLDLEEFEHQQFQEEREVLKAVEAANEERQRAKLERQKERAKRKGVVVFEEVESTEDATDGGNEEVGKHGRARPTYKHLFKNVKEWQRRKRDPATGELMSLSEDGEDLPRSEDESNDRIPPVQLSKSLGPVEKRRRRKRDKVTGELLPLSPVAQHTTVLGAKKRGRPKKDATSAASGMRSEPVNNSDLYTERRTGSASQSFRKLSIVAEPQAKRQRLDRESSASRSASPIPTKAEIAAQFAPNGPAAVSSLPAAPREHTMMELATSDDEFESEAAPDAHAARKPLPQPRTSSHTHLPVGDMSMSSACESSPESEGRTSIVRPSATKAMNSTSSIGRTGPRLSKSAAMPKMKPLGTRASSTDPLADISDEVGDESQDDDLEEDEYIIEIILNHAYSDPKTHPQEFGARPVRLYQVKWEGSDELTWEPIISFGDRDIVRDYRSQVGLDSEPSDDDMEADEEVTLVAPTSKQPLPAAPQAAIPQKLSAAEKQHEDEESDDEEFEVEDILAHHMSDPRTHPPEFGRTAIILYQVKWKGWDKLTWEPASSFPDKSPLQQYHVRAAKKAK